MANDVSFINGRKPNSRLVLSMVVAWLLSTSAMAYDFGMTRGTRALQTTYFHTLPINVNATTQVSMHVTNVSPAPLRLFITSPIDGRYECLDLAKPLPPPKKGETREPCELLDIEGVDFVDGTRFTPNPERVAWSGDNLKILEHYSYRWRLREGITLMPGEGYMQRIYLLPGWHEYDDNPEGDNPKGVVIRERKDIVFDAFFTFAVCKPRPVLEAVRPGEPILWERFYACSASEFKRCLPFRYALGETTVAATAKHYAAVQDAAHNAPGVFAELEINSPVAADQDLAVTYVIGARGFTQSGASRAYWLEQKSLLPANAILILKEGEGDKAKECARFTGENLQALMDAMPLRPPVMLNHGEFLAYHRTLPSSSLHLKKKTTYTMELELKANWAPYVPQKNDPYDFDDLDEHPPVAPPPLEKLTRQTLTAKYVFKTK